MIGIVVKNDIFPLVSIIIPVYNVESHLEECLYSVISQTYENLEIIIIDDGSTDSSGRICDRYALRDERIIVSHNENKGRSSARNNGLELMTGDYYTFVDADDILVSDAIEVLVGETTGNTDIVFARIVDFYQDNVQYIGTESNNVSCISANELIQKFVLERTNRTGPEFEVYNGPYARLYKSGLKNIHFADDLSYAEDYLYSLMIFLNCQRIRYIDRIIYRYRRYYEEENHFWKGFRDYSLEETEARLRAIKLVRENRKDIFEDYLLRSYYSILDAFCTCTRLGYTDSAKKISEMLDGIKAELKNCSSYRSLNGFSRIKLRISFFSYGLYAFLYEGRNRFRRKKG